MSISEVDYKFLLEVDNNPVVIFNHSGSILYLNTNAELLMSYASIKEIFDLSLKNAPKEYGSKTTQIELNYNHLNFYAINVSYDSDSWIAIRLYYRPREKLPINSNRKNYTMTDLNKMLDIAIIQFKIESNADIRLFTDQDIPNSMINQNSFLKLIRVILSEYKSVSYLDITLKLGIGEHIVLDEKRYPLVILEFKSNGRYCSNDSRIKELSKELCLVVNLNENNIFLEIPLIKN